MPSRVRTSLPSSCDDSREKASAIAVYLSNSDDCTHKLRRPRTMRAPSLVIQLTENSVEHRDGSDQFPIELPALKKYNGEAVSEVMVRLADGSIAAWNLGNFTGRKKIVLENGSLKLVDDLLPDLFAGAICEGSCNDVDSIVGLKMMQDTSCVGQPPVIRYQIVRIPKCCCAESTPLETCEPASDFEAVLASGDITLPE